MSLLEGISSTLFLCGILTFSALGCQLFVSKRASAQPPAEGSEINVKEPISLQFSVVLLFMTSMVVIACVTAIRNCIVAASARKKLKKSAATLRQRILAQTSSSSISPAQKLFALSKKVESSETQAEEEKTLEQIPDGMTCEGDTCTLNPIKPKKSFGRTSIEVVLIVMIGISILLVTLVCIHGFSIMTSHYSHTHPHPHPQACPAVVQLNVSSETTHEQVVTIVNSEGLDEALSQVTKLTFEIESKNDLLLDEQNRAVKLAADLETSTLKIYELSKQLEKSTSEAASAKSLFEALQKDQENLRAAMHHLEAEIAHNATLLAAAQKPEPEPQPQPCVCPEPEVQVQVREVVVHPNCPPETAHEVAVCPICPPEVVCPPKVECPPKKECPKVHNNKDMHVEVETMRVALQTMELDHSHALEDLKKELEQTQKKADELSLSNSKLYTQYVQEHKAHKAINEELSALLRSREEPDGSSPFDRMWLEFKVKLFRALLCISCTYVVALLYKLKKRHHVESTST